MTRKNKLLQEVEYHLQNHNIVMEEVLSYRLMVKNLLVIGQKAT